MTLPRFSLRLLLVAVAVLCAWPAWERSVVMQRKAAIEEMRRDPESAFVATSTIGTPGLR